MFLRSSLIGAVSVLSGIVSLLAFAPPALSADDGSIGGRVMAVSDGAPLADTRVDLHRLDPSTGNWQQFSWEWTSADGRYLFINLPAGRYRLCADSNAGVSSGNPAKLYLRRCWRTAPSVGSADEVVLESGAEVRGVVIRLLTRGRIRGNVTGPGGDPADGGYARAYWRESGEWAWGDWDYIDENGDYELRVDDKPAHHVCFHPSDVDQLATECWDDADSLTSSTAIQGARPNQIVEGIDAQLGPGARIEGSITGYPTGTQGVVAISAYRNDGDGWWAVGFNSLEPYTNPLPYEINSLPAGDYRVCFTSQEFEFFPVFADECVGGGPNPATGADIEVTEGETTSNADVDLGAASTIRGRVSGISEPVPVQLLTASGEPIYRRLTHVNGSFGFAGLPNGSYKLAFNRAPGETRLAARFLKNKPEHAGIGSASVIDLGDGELASGNSTTLFPGGSITGRVVDSNGTGIPDCQVRGYTPDGSLVTRWSDTDEDGWFDVGGFTRGSYYLAVSGGSCGISAADLFFDAGAPSQLTENASLADPLAVALGVPTAVAGDLEITQLRNLVPPSISGTPQVGQPLTADPGTWSPAGVNFTYRWYADGVLVPGENDESFTPGTDQIGTRIRVRAIASLAGYATAGRTTPSSERVTP